jgi:hypothetical protein
VFSNRRRLFEGAAIREQRASLKGRMELCSGYVLLVLIPSSSLFFPIFSLVARRQECCSTIGIRLCMPRRGELGAALHK